MRRLASGGADDALAAERLPRLPAPRPLSAPGAKPAMVRPCPRRVVSSAWSRPLPVPLAGRSDRTVNLRPQLGRFLPRQAVEVDVGHSCAPSIRANVVASASRAACYAGYAALARITGGAIGWRRARQWRRAALIPIGRQASALRQGLKEEDRVIDPGDLLMPLDQTGWTAVV